LRFVRIRETQTSQAQSSIRPGTVQAPPLVPFEWNDEALELVRRPLCDMPPIPESAQSDAQVGQIVTYLKLIK
jgi:hypothetical protein